MGSVFDEFSKTEEERKKARLLKEAKRAKKNGTTNSKFSKDSPPPMPTLAGSLSPEFTSKLEEQLRLDKYEARKMIRHMDEMKASIDEQLKEIYNTADRYGLRTELISKIASLNVQSDVQNIQKIVNKVHSMNDQEAYEKAEKKGAAALNEAKNMNQSTKEHLLLEEVSPEESVDRAKKQVEDALTKERKAKLRGARQKWLPMQ